MGSVGATTTLGVAAFALGDAFFFALVIAYSL
jgi:hypothetical protein